MFSEKNHGASSENVFEAFMDETASEMIHSWCGVNVPPFLNCAGMLSRVYSDLIIPRRGR
jgi:hypothetical protein